VVYSVVKVPYSNVNVDSCFSKGIIYNRFWFQNFFRVRQ
jgi:hypothetical protein